MDEHESGLPPFRRVLGHRFTTREILLIDVVVVVGFLVLQATAGPRQTPRFSGVGWDTITRIGESVAGASVLVRHRFPRTALAVAAPVTFAVMVLRADGPATFCLPLVLYSVVVGSSRRRGEVVAVSVAAGAVVAGLVGGGHYVGPSVTGSVTVLLAGWLAGEVTRAERAYALTEAERTADRAARLEAAQAERVRQAIADERVKIARELHDVVAHAMSVIAVRSGVARMVIDDQPDQARQALSIIETTTRRTLQEMRLLVGMLREGNDEAAERGPAPGVEDLARLVQEIEAAGVSVDVEVVGAVRPLPPAADLSAFRIIQEALTNVVRHAGPTTARVRIAYCPDALGITVCDDGPAPGSHRLGSLTRSGTGHGLIGMRERTALFGGTLRAEPADGGFRVEATLMTDG